MNAQKTYDAEQIRELDEADCVFDGIRLSNTQVTACAGEVNNFVPYNKTQTGGNTNPASAANSFALPPSPPPSFDSPPPPAYSPAPPCSSDVARERHDQINVFLNLECKNVQFCGNGGNVNNLPMGMTPPQSKRPGPNRRIKNVIRGGHVNGGQIDLCGGNVNNWQS